MNRLVKSLIIILIASFGLSAGAYAAFTSQALNKGNIISTGTLKLSVDTNPDIPGFQTDPLFNLSGFKAGNSQTKRVIIKNSGSLKLSYNSNVVKISGDDGLYTAVQLKVGSAPGSGNLYDGSLSVFNSFTAPSRVLSGGASETVYFTLTLPEGADENLQGKSLSVDFNFNSVQST